MLVHGPWEAFEKWPEPPNNPEQDYEARCLSRYVTHHIRSRDSRKELEAALQGIWFLCRYGMQRYRELLAWPASEITLSMNLLGKWIEKEGPKTSAGPS